MFEAVKMIQIQPKFKTWTFLQCTGWKQSCDIPALNPGSQQSIVSVSVHVRDGCGAPALW